MKILALEFSSSVRSVSAGCLAPGGSLTEAVCFTLREDQAVPPLNQIQVCLQKMDWTPADVEGLVVGLGPGSYAGIRSAVALSLGWHLGRHPRLTARNSLDVMADQLIARGWEGDALLAVPAHAGAFHGARISLGANRPPPLLAMEWISGEELRQRVQSGLKVFGPDMGRWHADAEDLYPDSESLVRWALRMDISKWPEVHDWQPISLRQTAYVKAPPPRSW